MTEMLYMEAMAEGIMEEMEKDEKVFIIGENVQQGTFMGPVFYERFGAERVMDSPLDECLVAGAATGAAMAGYRPIADFMFADFMMIAADEIMSKAAKWHAMHAGKVSVPVVFLAATGYGYKLGPEHTQSPEAYFMHTPGLKLALPSSPYDVKGLIKTAIRDNNPVVFFYNKTLIGLTGEVPEEEYTVLFGVAYVKREGSDVTVVATSQMVQHALAVAAELEGNVSIEVVDPRTLAPLDMDTIVKSVEKTGRVVIVDEDTKTCGVTAEIGIQVVEKAFDFLDAPPERVAMPDVAIPGGSLESQIAPQAEDIRIAIERVMG